MSMNKKQNFKVESFKFGPLIPKEGEEVIENAEQFAFKSLNESQSFKNNITDEVIRQERESESKTAFTIDKRVRDHRGISNQEDSDYEKRVSAEVEARIEKLQKEAFEAGFNAGQEEGHKLAYEEAKEQSEAHVDQMIEIVSNLQSQTQSILAQNRDDVYRVVRNLTKWIILKEVDEKYYLSRLLEKLVNEINTKSNLTIRVNESSFGYMPEIIKVIERKVGVLTNIRTEVDLNLGESGIILESENAIIDGSLEAQMKSLDELFENVGI